MTANVETMAYAPTADGSRATPWHGLGTALDDVATGAEVLTAAQLDWTVAKTPMLVAPHDGLEGTTVPGWVAIQRSSDGNILGVVRSTFQPTQNTELTKFIDYLVDDGAAKYETAGSLAGGQTVWVQARLPRTLQVVGDSSEIATYIHAFTGHDGRRAFTVGTGIRRIVCENTLNAAHKDAKDSIAIRHTGRVIERVGEARAALNLSLRYLDTFQSLADEMTSRQFSQRALDAFLADLLPVSADPEVAEKQVRTLSMRASIEGLYDGSPTLAGVPKNGWRVYNAVAEWADHEKTYAVTSKTNADDQRAYSLLDGQTAELKSRALALLTA